MSSLSYSCWCFCHQLSFSFICLLLFSLFFIPLPLQALFLLLNVHCLYILQFSFFLSFFTRMSTSYLHFFLFASSHSFPVASHRSVISTVSIVSLYLNFFLGFFHFWNYFRLIFFNSLCILLHSLFLLYSFFLDLLLHGLFTAYFSSRSFIHIY